MAETHMDGLSEIRRHLQDLLPAGDGVGALAQRILDFIERPVELFDVRVTPAEQGHFVVSFEPSQRFRDMRVAIAALLAKLDGAENSPLASPAPAVAGRQVSTGEVREGQ